MRHADWRGRQWACLLKYKHDWLVGRSVERDLWPNGLATDLKFKIRNTNSFFHNALPNDSAALCLMRSRDAKVILLPYFCNHSYCRTLLRKHTRVTKWNRFQWPWVTFTCISRSHYGKIVVPSDEPFSVLLQPAIIDDWAGSQILEDWRGLDPRKNVGGVRVCFNPLKMSHSFIQNCCQILLLVSHIIKDERLVSKMEIKTIFRGA